MADRTIGVWDPVVRVFHWSLAVSFATAWLTADDAGQAHEAAGYAAAALVIMRTLWGFFGTLYARFTQFVRPPSAIVGYLTAATRGAEPRDLGHNPAGGAMIAALLIVIAGVATTGWMYTLDAFWGVKWVEATHEALANLLLAMVALHVAGVLLASFRHRENLVRAMIVGRKRAPGPADIV